MSSPLKRAAVGSEIRSDRLGHCLITASSIGFSASVLPCVAYNFSLKIKMYHLEIPLRYIMKLKTDFQIRRIWQRNFTLTTFSNPEQVYQTQK